MKILYTLLLCSFLNLLFGQAPEQGLSISIKKLKKLSVHPIKHTKVTVVINGVDYFCRSNNIGQLDLIKLPEGEYNIEIKSIKVNPRRCNAWHPSTVTINKGEIKRTSIICNCENKDIEDIAGKRDAQYNFWHGFLSLFIPAR